ncbi:unnamed protein product [Toxocara canis]|uniref:RNA polymerase II-associated factor 1 homolog n=1 Tax=Toxocara canis TaxID=6265 RepID=A0A183V9G2_TOXCA|nr:unnamed protein product [Toxocara canis]
MLEHLQLSFTADESFPVTRFDESAYCDEMTEDVPLDVSGGDEQLCSLLSKLRIASDVSPMVEDRKQKAKVLTPTGKQATTTIEPFYHPGGKPVSSEDNKNALRKAYQIFTWCGNKITFTKMVDICDAMGIPRYWKRPIFNNCVRNPNEDTITVDSFVDFWGRMTAVAHDDAARFVFALTNGTRDYVEYSDFASLIMDVVETHPSLDFLKSDSRFHNAYVETVTCRIFWNVNRSWSGRIKAAELRRSNFLDVLRDLNTKDVNDLLDYFSYEHFYVVYCKFQELADGRDCITPEELANYERGVLPDIVVTRIFTGAVSRGAHSEENLKQQKAMTYKEFVYFLMAEVDKSNPTSIEYWFRVLDLNGDGRLSMDELQQFFDGIIAKMNAANIDAMSFTDVICLLWDAVRPCCEAYITLSDIKRSQVSTYFLNTFINWLKYFLQETCEGSDRIVGLSLLSSFCISCDSLIKRLVNIPEGKQHEMSEWNTYCEKEHDVLMAENEDGEEFDENFNDSALEAHDVALREMPASVNDVPTSSTNGVPRKHPGQDRGEHAPTVFIEYKQTMLEKKFKFELLAESDLGVKIDLINPETYFVDMDTPKKQVHFVRHIFFFWLRKC